ncbi:MBOAT family O-acyltransferase [Pseudoduganella lutea]|uniref:Probable alginate O-acetylase AlgI n=1 Tax=Pseudoduganella lutea TaxID=321985 RepID=A0A4P6KWH0_9BURK|nr:MBOAT family protein [Pseudoduganella lutea]QBE62538.1 MBOAT family protein [Pseudoduganella lutea]
MLFNTFAFFLVFLPVSLAAYFLISRKNLRASIVFLLIASVAFYSYSEVEYLPLLALSIICNFIVGNRIVARRESEELAQARRWLIAGLIFNLSLLIFFKYANFIVVNFAAASGLDIPSPQIALPIGISFFTFTQIAYLVDCHQGKVRETRPESYGLFVTYFPHLIAGPILHHKEMIPQFDAPRTHVFGTGRLTVGMAFFTIGLFKKVILADGVARFVAPVFDQHYAELTQLEAWAGALAYTFQLYFDFSAYSDMAYGLSYMFGIILPVNFLSPYRSTSIIEFWRRWHITLSTFLRDYLYIPLGGNRKGPVLRYVNLLITMLLGGLWHGANWTFIVWGALHGFYLIINHALRTVFGEHGGLPRKLAGWVATSLAVIVAWVVFRANTLESALLILQAMLHGTAASSVDAAWLGVDRIMPMTECLWWLAGCTAIVLLLPNAYQLLGRGELPAMEQRLQGPRGGLLIGVLLAVSLLLLAISETRGVSEFLYFNF